MKVWTKKQQVVFLSTAESEMYAAVKNPRQKDWDPECGEGPGQRMWVELTSGCFSDDVPGQPQSIGQSETRRHAELVGIGGLRVRKVRHVESGDELEPR